MSSLESNRTIEIVQCLNCNSVVPKRLYCRKCGKVLLDSTIKAIPESTIEKEEFTPYKEKEINTQTKSSQDFAYRTPYDQLKTIRAETKGIEDYRTVYLKDIRQGNQESLKQNDIAEISYKAEKITSPPNNQFEKQGNINTENNHKIYTPDLYVKEIIEKVTKSVKYEVNLVQLLQQGQMTEEVFTRLFNGLADETQKLNIRRAQSINEITNSMKGYESTVLSAQQGMKLLNLRKSIGDASEEEVIVKSSALNWDIKAYGNKILDGRKKSDYLKTLGKLILEEELNELENIALKYSDDANLCNVGKATSERIIKAMQEVASILREASANSISQYF
jgi:hypothetical protein